MPLYLIFNGLSNLISENATYIYKLNNMIIKKIELHVA